MYEQKHGKEDKTDHEIDMEFGRWLRDLRAAAKLTLEQAATQSGVSAERLKSLELGYAEKGVTQQESKRICATYKVSLEEFLAHAVGDA